MSWGADNRRDLTDCRGGPRERRRKDYKPQYALLSFGGARGEKKKNSWRHVRRVACWDTWAFSLEDGELHYGTCSL